MDGFLARVQLYHGEGDDAQRCGKDLPPHNCHAEPCSKDSRLTCSRCDGFLRDSGGSLGGTLRSLQDRVPAPHQEDQDAGTDRLQSCEPEGVSEFHPGPVPRVGTQQRTLSGSVSHCTSRAADG